MISTLLEEEIQSDIDSRNELLLSTKTLYVRYGFSRLDEQFFLNYSIPIVYSIWEGFMQTSFQTYIRVINREIVNQSLSIDKICKSILVYHMETKFKQFKQYPNDEKSKYKFYDNLSTFYKDSNFQIYPTINTQSNVGFEVMNKILQCFNLTPISEYPISRYNIADELDKFLLKIRNDVAHGVNAVLVNRDDLERAIRLVEFLMQLVFDSIKEGYRNQTFKDIT